MNDKDDNASSPQNHQPPKIINSEEDPWKNIEPEAPPAPKEPWEGLRRFLAWNPMYLLSAALLLYSFYLVASDRSFLPTDIAQLSFNLSSLQLYEIALVITAVWLARRAVWYDSTLLVGLENLLILVPFILISEAALINARHLWLLCGAVGVLAVCRLSVLKGFIQQLNFPPALIASAVVMLVVNAVLPAVYRMLHESKVGTNPDWGAAFETNQYVWWLLVPALGALSQMVPLTRGSRDELWPQRHWLPLGLFSLWLVGTGVHLYCLGYVYDFPLRPELLAPGVWMLSWLLWFRLSPRMSDLAAALRNAFWIPPLLATLLAIPQTPRVVFPLLTALNLGLFGYFYARERIPLALHLGAISLIAFLGGLPPTWMQRISFELTPGHILAGAIAIYLLVCISTLRNAKLGLVGAIVAGGMVRAWADPRTDASHWAMQAGIAFVLLHSLRWIDSKEPGSGLLRWLAALAWVTHSLVWVHLHGGGWKASALAIPVLAVLLAVRLFQGKWPSPALWISTLLVLVVAPAHLCVMQARSAPAGVLAVAGSFLLFGLGTLAALTKHRWRISQHTTT